MMLKKLPKFFLVVANNYGDSPLGLVSLSPPEKVVN